MLVGGRDVLCLTVYYASSSLGSVGGRKRQSSRWGRLQRLCPKINIESLNVHINVLS
jgi:hypothetical protein